VVGWCLFQPIWCLTSVPVHVERCYSALFFWAVLLAFSSLLFLSEHELVKDCNLEERKDVC